MSFFMQSGCATSSFQDFRLVVLHTCSARRGQKFTHTFQNLQDVNYFNNIKGIMQIACYFFNIRYFTLNIVTYSPQDKNLNLERTLFKIVFKLKFCN